MKQFKIKIQEKVSAWRELEMLVEAEDLETLKKQIERDDMNILNVEQVHYFDETTEHIEYDMEYFDVMDEYAEEVI